LSDSTVQSFDPFIVAHLTTGVLSVERGDDFALQVLILKLFVMASFEIISIFLTNARKITDNAQIPQPSSLGKMPVSPLLPCVY